jgi:hypothetical protein
MNITPQIQMGILTYKADTIGQLEGLLSVHEKVVKRTAVEDKAYELLIYSKNIFPDELVSCISGISDFKTSNGKLKPSLLRWMVRYTDHAPSALYLATLVKTTFNHIRTGLSKFNSLKNNNPQAKKPTLDLHVGLRLVLMGTRYEVLYSMINELYTVTYSDADGDKCKVAKGDDSKKKHYT